MKNNSILIIILVLILIVLFGSFIFHTFNNHDDEVKVGDVLFKLPEGFEEVSSENNKITLKNDSSSIGIQYYADNNITKYVDDYGSKNEPDSIETTSLNTNNVTLYKSIIINDTRYIHYWFVDNNKVYTIYTWEGNDDTDQIVFELLSNRKPIS